MLINTSSHVASSEPKANATLAPSPEQQAICDFVRDSARNLLVDASPGSGKSTTIGMAARALPLGKLYVALAFNKAAADAFVGKLPHHVQSGTWHSVCLGAIRQTWPKLRVKADKVKWIIKDNHPDVKWEHTSQLIKLVSLCKQQPEMLSEDDVSELADTFSIDLEPSLVAMTLDILQQSDSDEHNLDFDDMLRFALRESVRFPHYGLIFVDEAQDTNAVQRAVLAKMAARTVVVGDPYQSIYGFRGASHSAMDELRHDLDAEVLPLSVSYRCPQSVVAEAQRVLASPRFTLRAVGETAALDSVGQNDRVCIEDNI